MYHCPATLNVPALPPKWRYERNTGKILRGHLRRQHITRTLPAKFSTERDRREHQQDLRRARANRKLGWAEISRPAQSVVQPSSALFFAPPTAPIIPLTATGHVNVFMLGAAAPSVARECSVRCDRPKVTTQSYRSKLCRARRKLDRSGPSLGLLQPDILLCPMDDSSVEDSEEQASAASTVPLLVTLLSLLRGLRPDLPRHR
jgi:hypothetical protein